MSELQTSPTTKKPSADGRRTYTVLPDGRSSDGSSFTIPTEGGGWDNPDRETTSETREKQAHGAPKAGEAAAKLIPVEVDSDWEEPHERPYDPTSADFDKGEAAQANEPLEAAEQDKPATSDNETQEKQRSPEDVQLDKFARAVYDTAIIEGSTPEEAARKSAVARDALENMGAKEEAPKPQPAETPETPDADNPEETPEDIPEDVEDLEQLPIPTAETAETQETGEDFEPIGDLKYDEVKDFDDRQLEKHVDGLFYQATHLGSLSNQVKNLRKLGEQVKEVQEKIKEDIKAAKKEYDEQGEKIKQMEAEDPNSRYLLQEYQKREQMGKKNKMLKNKDRYLDKMDSNIRWEAMVKETQQSWAERRQEAREEAGKIGAVATSGQESRQANRLGKLKDMSYADIYKSVLENKTAGRKRILGPLNRLSARWQANKIAKDAKKSGGHSDTGSLQIRDRAGRAASREAAERQIRSDKREARIENRRSNAAGRAANRFAQFS